MQYYKKEESKINCLLCRHSCKWKEDQVGMYGVNKNMEGELKTLVCSHPVAVHIDPVEKKPNYHLLPGSRALSFGTVGCNFRCSFSQNWDMGISLSPEMTKEYC